jgi:hypothetical protein
MIAGLDTFIRIAPGTVEVTRRPQKFDEDAAFHQYCTNVLVFSTDVARSLVKQRS